MHVLSTQFPTIRISRIVASNNRIVGYPISENWPKKSDIRIFGYPIESPRYHHRGQGEGGSEEGGEGEGAGAGRDSGGGDEGE